MGGKDKNICELPEQVLENIFKYLTFDEIAKNRVVSLSSNSFVVLKYFLSHSANFSPTSGLSQVQPGGLEHAESWILHTAQLPLKALQENQVAAATTRVRTSISST